jgi:hypothetical protein
MSGTCQNEECIRQGTRLNECHCEDGMHRMVLRPRPEGDNVEEENKDAQELGYSTTTIDLDNEDSKD